MKMVSGTFVENVYEHEKDAWRNSVTQEEFPLP